MPATTDTFIRVLHFSYLRVATETGEEQIPADGIRDGETLWSYLASRHEGLGRYRPTVRLAVNGAFVPFDFPINAGDEAAFIPPVSGG